MKRLLILIFILCIGISQAYAQISPGMSGVIESAVYDGQTRQVTAQGWALAGKDGSAPPDLLLHVRGSTVPVQEIKWIEREDLSAVNPMMAGQKGLGFAFHVQLPRALPSGSHVLRVDAVFPDGANASLQSLSGAETMIKVEGVLTRHIWLAGVVLLVAVLIQRLAIRFRHRTSIPWLRGWVVPVAMVGAFLALVAVGVSGSSFGVMLNDPVSRSLWAVEGSQGRLFKLRGIRGDEGRVLMPNVLAQIHHRPPFPVVNRNIGPDGQNMGVIGMTGVPVAQWAALARPATWGYFVLPMRQAMAWQWQLPFWGCFLALWCVLNLLRPDRRGLNLALSGAFCIAPYAAAWSNWPLYATMFPLLAFLAFSKLITTREFYRVALLSLILGWLLACWVLVLYPPWLVIVGSAMGFVGLGWAMERREQLHFGWLQAGGLLLAGLVALSLLGSWWIDTRDAISLIQATEYPGARGTLTGGDVNWWWHLRGYHNAETVASLAGPVTNQSEVSSYFYLPLLWAALAVMNWRSLAGRRYALLACFLFVLCYWIFSFFGVPAWLAKYTLWGHMPTGRMEVGMGLVGIFILTLSTGPYVRSGWRNSFGWPFLVAAASAGLIALAIVNTPDVLLPGRDWLLTITMAGSGALICWWILRGREGAGVAMLVTVHLIATLHFNPIVRAPLSVALDEGHRIYINAPAEEGHLHRTLVIGDGGTGALAFAAVGLPVVNGVLYYPHADFWRRMGLPESDWKIVNRYQHLAIELSDRVDAENGYRVFSPVLDQVHLQINPGVFDFSKSGAERVVTLAADAAALKGNSSLRWLGQHNSIDWFAVQSAGNMK